MVDADRAEARIERLEELIERLERVRKKGEDMEVDDRAVFASLAFLDDLRQFAVFAQGRIG